MVVPIPKVSFVVQSIAQCSSTRATHWGCFLVGRVGMPGYGTTCTVSLLFGPSQWLTGIYMHYKCSQRPGILRSQGMYYKSCFRVMQAPSCVVCNCSPHVHADMLVMIRVVPTNWSKVLSSACEAFSSAT